MRVLSQERFLRIRLYFVRAVAWPHPMVQGRLKSLGCKYEKVTNRSQHNKESEHKAVYFKSVLNLIRSQNVSRRIFVIRFQKANLKSIAQHVRVYKLWEYEREETVQTEYWADEYQQSFLVGDYNEVDKEFEEGWNCDGGDLCVESHLL